MMKDSNTVAELCVTLAQLAFIIFSFCKFHFAIAFCIIIGVFLSFNLFVRYILKLEPLRSNDKLLLGDDFLDRQLIMASCEIENFNAQAIYERLANLAFARIEKLRVVLTYKFFNYYWTKSNLPLIDVVSSRVIIKENMTKQEILEFSHTQIEYNMDLRDSPIMFYLIPIKPESELSETSKGVLIIKTDHCFTDGMGILNLMACISDNFDEKLFPTVMRKRSASVFSKILDFVLFLLIGPFVLLYIIITTKSSLKFSDNARSTKINLSKIYSFNLDEIKKKSKDLKYTINDLCISTLLSSIKKYKVQEQAITLMIPLGLSPIPKSMEDAQISNHVSGIIKKMTLIDDPIKDMEQFRCDSKALMRQAVLIRITDWAIYFLSLAFPFNVFKKIGSDVFKEINCCCTNVPGTNEPIVIGNQKIVNVEAFASTGYITLFFLIVSYNGKLHIRAVSDKAWEIDVDVILKNFENTLNSILREGQEC